MIFYEVHNDLPRQSPGSIQSTLRALCSVDSSGKQLDILDIGCGTGVATIELAKLGHRVTAIDHNELFIQKFLVRIDEEHLSDRVTALVGDMHCLEKFINSKTFDVIWSEGSIYITGFEHSLIEWKKFLNTDGFLVCSELSWLTTDRPLAVREFWSKNYPGMLCQEEDFEIIRKCGYELIDSFILDEKDWWNEYYGPMEKQIQDLKMKYHGQQEAENVLREQQNEIDLYREYSENYGYIFYIMKKIN